MVVYDLICSQGHHFEGWFANLEDLERQLAERLLSCPVCGDENLSRKPSTFGLVKSSGRPEPDPPTPPAGAPDPRHIRELLRQWETMSRQLEKEYDDVGSNFADEALKMHYGISDRRNIRGLSTDTQEDMLRKEGIEFFKVPLLARKNTPSTNN